MEHKPKIALVVSHPIQHFCPQYASFATNPNVRFKVFFASALGLKKYVDPNFKKEISWANLNLDQFEHHFLNGDVALPSSKDIDAPALDQELAGFEPDLVVIYGYFQKLQRRAHRWAKKNNVSLAYISDSELRQKRSRLRELVKYWWVRHYFSSIRFFLSVGDANEDFYRHYGVSDDRMLRMHFPIDIKQYEAAYEMRHQLRNKVRKEFDICNDVLVICVVGKLVGWKNQDHLIDALAALESEGVYAEALIVGSGPMDQLWKQKAQKLSKNKVHFAGFVSPAELPGYYAASDVYVHPASVEPHSIAVSEAIFMSLPVIMSDRCGSYGPSDDVQPNHNGFIYPFGDIQALAGQILKFCTNIDLRRTFGARSHKNAVAFQQRAHDGIMNELSRKLSRG